MVLLRKIGSGWSSPSLTNYGSEEDLQRLLADSPDLIPGAAATATAREFQVPGVGGIDILCVGAEGGITLVECKLATNADIRRTVIGQIFAYASGLRGMSFDAFSARFAARVGKPLLAGVEAAAGREVDPDEFRSAIERRLEDGSFRLVVAVDSITNELRGIVEYLHKHLSSDVPIVALELGYLRVQADDELLVPRTYGAELAEEKSTQGGAAPRRRWAVEELREASGSIGNPGARMFVDRLWSHAQAHGAVFIGGTGAVPSGGFYYPINGKRPSLWSIWVNDGVAAVALNIGSITNAFPKLAGSVLTNVRTSAALNAPLPNDDVQALSKYPKYDANTLAEASDAADVFVRTLDMVAGPSPAPSADGG